MENVSISLSFLIETNTKYSFASFNIYGNAPFCVYVWRSFSTLNTNHIFMKLSVVFLTNHWLFIWGAFIILFWNPFKFYSYICFLLSWSDVISFFFQRKCLKIKERISLDRKLDSKAIVVFIATKATTFFRSILGRLRSSSVT